MFKVVPWTPLLNLSLFYATALKKGFLNNASQHMLVDCFNKEREKQVWILYYNNIAVGSVAAHSFDEMGENSYRIAARTCVFTDHIPINTLRTVNQIITHQNITAQYLIPVCIQWAHPQSKLYITTNENTVGAQCLVHRIFGPAMERSGQMAKITDIVYRGTNQTVWQLFADKFLERLDHYGRWSKL
jgi:hypothetical protein